jgi:hypothetical protein
MYRGDPGGVLCSAGGRDIAFPTLYRVVQDLADEEDTPFVHFKEHDWYVAFTPNGTAAVVEDLDPPEAAEPTRQ